MAYGLEINNTPAFADYIIENASDPGLKEGVELAEKWAAWTISLTRQYDGAIQQDLRMGLLGAQGYDIHAKDEEIETSGPNNWEQVMRAADILSRFWSRSPEFVLWTVDGPYKNGYGNWIDPISKKVVEEDTAASLIRERLAA
jgi:hypothetical protein